MAAAVTQRFTNRAKAIFVEALEETGNVSEAARLACVSRRTAYNHRERYPEFAAAWDEALEVAVDGLEFEARRRAVTGVDEPVFYQGAEVATVTKYSDTLLIQLLKAHHPAHRETIKHKHEHAGSSDGPPIRVEHTAPIEDVHRALEIVAEVCGDE